jgi:hypothetical protein
MRLQARVVAVLGCAAVVALEGWALLQWQGTGPRHDPALQAREQSMRVDPRQAAAPVQALPQPTSPEPPRRDEDPHFAQLRQRLQWVHAEVGGRTHLTLDAASRMLLAKSAAQRARLQEVGLGFEDVYGIIDAETSWAPRTGVSRDGTPNLGLAQFEPATAQALGVRDPHDPVEAVHAAAWHMREAAQWSAARIARLQLDRKQRAARLREGVSVYYNLSSKGRAAWNGRNADGLPRATAQHIHNAKRGAQEAAHLDTQLRLEALRSPVAPQGEAVQTAQAPTAR